MSFSSVIYSFTMFLLSPFINASIFLQVSLTQRFLASTLAHARCGVINSFLLSIILLNGLLTFIGSVLVTSRPAA